MHSTVRATAAALGTMALWAAIAAPAVGQRPPPPPYDPHPVLSADLGLGGSGAFSGVADRETGQLCYMIYAAGVQNPTAASIRDSKTNTEVVKLAVPTGGTSGGCANIGQDLAKKLVANPDAYSVAIASAMYPNGTAASGQLQVEIPDKPVA